VCDLENLKNEVAMTRVGSQRHRKKNEEDIAFGEHGRDVEETVIALRYLSELSGKQREKYRQS